MEITELIIVILSTYRLAQIIAQDAISEPLRVWVSKNGVSPDELSPVRRWLAYLLHCVLCVSVWVGIGLAALWLYAPLSRFFIIGLAASGGAVMAGSVLAAHNRPKHQEVPK